MSRFKGSPNIEKTPFLDKMAYRRNERTLSERHTWLGYYLDTGHCPQAYSVNRVLSQRSAEAKGNRNRYDDRLILSPVDFIFVRVRNDTQLVF